MEEVELAIKSKTELGWCVIHPSARLGMLSLHYSPLGHMVWQCVLSSFI
jgi:hypothetical protein